MKNYKKPSTHSIGEGESNKNSINVLNPKEFPYKMRGKNWVNPNNPDFPKKNTTQIKTTVTQNKETTLKQKEDRKV
jgi:hypothetical protein